ncbi:hypothetical protein NUACC21_49900 [Scytonema sp. NUACC21]
MKKNQRKFKKYWIFALTSFALTLLLVIPLRLTIARYYAPLPQAFFTLGGDPAREQVTANLAKWYPSLEIWVSSPPNAEKTREVFQSLGIPSTKLHIDYRAVDTVTNFTSLIEDFKKRHLQHIYLITSNYHMPRAKAIATIIFGSQGITFTPVSVPSNQPTESSFRIFRDVLRSLIWIFTGSTGASLGSSLSCLPYAFRSILPW